MSLFSRLFGGATTNGSTHAVPKDEPVVKMFEDNSYCSNAFCECETILCEHCYQVYCPCCDMYHIGRYADGTLYWACDYL